MWQAHRKAAGSRGQDSEQLLKARLPTLLTELILLDRKGKGPGQEADLLSLPSWWILYECSFMMGRMVMWAPLIFIMYQSQTPVIDSKSIHKSLIRGRGEASVSLLGIWMESFFQRVTSGFYQAIPPNLPPPPAESCRIALLISWTGQPEGNIFKEVSVIFIQWWERKPIPPARANTPLSSRRKKGNAFWVLVGWGKKKCHSEGWAVHSTLPSGWALDSLWMLPWTTTAGNRWTVQIKEPTLPLQAWKQSPLTFLWGIYSHLTIVSAFPKPWTEPAS